MTHNTTHAHSMLDN